METILLSLITLITLLLPFIIEKVLTFLSRVLRTPKNKTAEKITECKYKPKENHSKIALLTELNFVNTFYTPA